MTKNYLEQPVTKKEFRKDMTTLRKELTTLEIKLNAVDGKMGRRMDHLLSYINDVKRNFENRIDSQSKFLGTSLEVSLLAAERRLNEQAKQYRDQILNTFDKYLKEVLDSRQERVLINGKLANHEDRLEKLESVVAVDKEAVTDSK